MKTNHAILLSFVLVSTLLSACGTVSPIKSADETQKTMPDLSTFTAVTVLDFENKTNKPEADFATTHFADLIVSEIKATGAFETVVRQAGEDGSLMISGDITRYKKGSGAARLLIGFGAGSSYFDALVNISDSRKANQIAEIKVDRNSWALGGALAAGQTVDSFMKGAAKNVAKQLAEAKTGSRNTQ